MYEKLQKLAEKLHREKLEVGRKNKSPSTTKILYVQFYPSLGLLGGGWGRE